jgi:hypothetical protein
LYRATNFTQNDSLLWTNNSDPKRFVSEYFIVNRDMINGSKYRILFEYCNQIFAAGEF